MAVKGRLNVRPRMTIPTKKAQPCIYYGNFGAEISPQDLKDAPTAEFLPPNIPVGSSVEASFMLQMYSIFIALLTRNCCEYKNRF